MSDPRLDALAETARNRGLKLVRSRVRTPGKRRFGKAGLTDAKGKPVFGMDAKGPAATPDAVEDYLRKLEAQDWGASLDAPVPRLKKPKREAANDSGPEPGHAPEEERPKAKPKPPPQPKLREAAPSDAPRIVELIAELEHDVDEKSVRKNLARLKKLGELPLVVALDKKVVGLIGRHIMVTVHRPKPVGRIPILVVTEEARGHKLGRMLVEAVEQWCRDQGCGLIEVTSNDRRAEAHAFYRHMGYERTSIRFAKTL
jgi:GNAT superfamily N-acetyltransferase